MVSGWDRPGMDLRNPDRQHLGDSALATDKHPGEQKEHRVSRYKEQTEEGPRRCLASAGSGSTLQRHSQGLGLRGRWPVPERAGDSKASGIKEKEPPFTQVLFVTIPLSSTFTHWSL